VRYTVALGNTGLCYGKGNAVSTRQARRAHNKGKHWIVKRWRVCRPLLWSLAQMNIRSLIFALFMLPLSCVATDFSVEDDDLANLPAPAEEIIRKDASFIDFRDCSLVGKSINLASDGERPSFIATTASGCAWAAASGPIWVVTSEQNGFHLILFSNGYSAKVGHTAQGMRDISIYTGTASWQSSENWEFGGNKYVKVKSQLEEKR
jgi:hypothetical protein